MLPTREVESLAMVDAAHILAIQSPKDPVGRVFFLHGLGGDSLETWTTRGLDGTSELWPEWIAAAYPTLAVHSIGYPNAASAWVGHAQDLQERANSLLHLIEMQQLLDRPCVFIVHSMGGLVLKQMLESARDREDQDALRSQTRGVLFLATPHSGSSAASFLKPLFFLLPTDAISALTADTGMLGNLQHSFRVWCQDQRAKYEEFRVRSMHETRRTSIFLRIVPSGRADPGDAKVPTVGVDANHIEMAKPHGFKDPIFLEAQRTIETVFGIRARPIAHNSTGFERDELDERDSVRKARVFRFRATVVLLLAAAGAAVAWWNGQDPTQRPEIARARAVPPVAATLAPTPPDQSGTPGPAPTPPAEILPEPEPTTQVTVPPPNGPIGPASQAAPQTPSTKGKPDKKDVKPKRATGAAPAGEDNDAATPQSAPLKRTGLRILQPDERN